MKVVTSAQMKQIELNSTEYGMTFARLMENAGSAAATFIRRTFRIEGLNCIIFCGSGNNGGDGFVVARKLHENGANVVVVLVDGMPTTKEASGALESIELMELNVLAIPADTAKITNCVQNADIVVDAIYGTGFHGEITGNALLASGLIANAIAAVISLDVPSGVECDTARLAPNSVYADFTVAFDSLKPVHVIKSGIDACGRIELVEIGMPEEAREGIEYIFKDITTEEVWRSLPQRDANSHKGTFGKLMAICGSGRYRGAAALAALGALRCGVGICCVASVEQVCALVAASVYEPVYLPLAQNADGGINAEEAIPVLRNNLDGLSAILFGCGLGNTADTAALLEFVLKNAKSPVVIDADGINALADNIDILQEANVPVILTPHPGEMSRLCGKSVADIQSDRIGTAVRFAVEKGVTLVLKGNESIIATPDGKAFVNHTGGPGLAKGGSGDILAGMIASFVSQGISHEMAAAGAVHLHGLAGDSTAARLSEYAMLPSELLEDLVGVFRSFRR